MKYIVIGIILILLVTLGACKPCEIQEPCFLEDVQTPVTIECNLTNDLDSVKLYIRGTWTWLQEERRQRGQPTKYLTPKTEGVSRVLKLQNDTATFYQCGKIVETHKFAIIRLKEISGTNFPEDEWSVLVYYNLETGLRVHHIPVKICADRLVMQNQFVSSIIGEEIWKREL